MRLLLRNVRLIDPSQEVEETCDLLLEDGKVARRGLHLSAEGAEVIDGTGLVAAPGLVDMHVHLRDPGLTYKEDLYSGCRAAAAGGVTSLLAMPNTKPAMDSPETVRDLLERAQTADAAVYTAACVTKDLQGEERTDWKALKEAGAIALSDDGRPVVNTRRLLEALEQAPGLGLVVTAHCEDLYLAARGLMHEGEVSRKLGVPGIPAAAEDCGTAREIAAAASLGAPIHICHVSTKGSVELIRDAKARGVRVTAETCPHYLLLTDQALESQDADYRMNPPLRTEEDRLALIEGLLDGTLDAIATDHAPHSPEEKADFFKAPNGSIGMETSLAATLTALQGKLSLSEILEKMSVNPARILGIPGGTLREGTNADVVLFDPEKEWVVDPEKLHGKSKNTPFKGRKLKGKVVLTIFRGRVVYDARC
ncbi:MAG TPA: dihydroorotase [Candidatus Acutalibacter pullicola]|uniref:Dihydroorotase n=1 Tax=Candidatus Acutalibacter pullicola TaxID=2838417 RepID=A0A9D2MW37_9FIRM|nr:dihydroorotase [Candidatus Acutalibacter pullicola]